MLLLLLACNQHVPHGASHGDCASCHPTEVAEWQTSQHAAAYTDPVFQRSWAEERSAWCTGCHLPQDGVTCATCHGAEARACADCHEFDLPAELSREGHPLRPSGTLGQSTVSEWASSGAAAAGQGCTDCHSPHSPRGGTDRDRVREAVSARVVHLDGDEVEATISVERIGHAFPTGDPFRRLELSLCADLSCRHPVAQVQLERRLEQAADGRWELALDSRVPAPAEGLDASRSFTVTAPEARAWQLVLHLSDPRHAADLGDRARYVVATGPVESP